MTSFLRETTAHAGIGFMTGVFSGLRLPQQKIKHCGSCKAEMVFERSDFEGKYGNVHAGSHRLPHLFLNLSM